LTQDGAAVSIPRFKRSAVPEEQSDDFELPSVGSEMQRRLSGVLSVPQIDSLFYQEFDYVFVTVLTGPAETLSQLEPRRAGFQTPIMAEETLHDVESADTRCALQR
jgi:hypothetical protein